MSKVRAAITGIHAYVPEYVLTNKELEVMVDTTDEWILERTGIKERRILKGEGLGTSFMAIKAAQGLLEKTNTDPKDIGLVIMATTTPDMLFPATANLVSHGIGATNAFGFDLQAACSGFIFALTTGSQYIENGFAKKVLVLGGDKMSSILDYQDRSTCVIFGDGVGAILLEPNTEGLGLQDALLCSDGSGQEYLYMKAGGSRYPPTAETVAKREHFVTQHGAAVFKHAVQNMSDVAQKVMTRNNLTHSDIAYLVPHQANKRIIESTAGRLGLSMEKVLVNIHKFGNTTSGTIPLCLWEHRNLFKPNDNLLLVAFGGGFTWGAIYLKWAITEKDEN